MAWAVDTGRHERELGHSRMSRALQLVVEDVRYVVHVCPGRQQFYRHNQMTCWESENVLYIHEPMQAARDRPESLSWQDLLTDCVGFGAKKFVVAVNKMDSLDWSEERYRAEVELVRQQLRSLGVGDEDLSFVPISGLRGENLLNKSGLMPWFEGDHLARCLKSFQLPYSPLGQGLRMVINHRYKVSGVGSCLVGRVASGSLNHRMNCALITPEKHFLVTINTVEAGLSPKENGADCGEIASANIKGISLRDIPRGSILIPLSDYPAKLFTTRFTAMLRWTAKKEKLKVGYEPTILYHVSKTSCRLTSIKHSTTEGDEWGEVEMQARNPIFVETVHDCEPLSKFVVKDNSRTLGYGFVLEKLAIEP